MLHAEVGTQRNRSGDDRPHKRREFDFLCVGRDQGNRMKSEERMVFALKGQPESSPVASALGPLAAKCRQVLKGRLKG